MRRWGITVDKHEPDGSLVLVEYQAVTTADGKLNDLKINQLLGALMNRGAPVRVGADPTLLVKRGRIDEIIRRERVLQRRLELPLTMVCPYEDTIAGTNDGRFLIEMLRTHNHAIFPGIALLLTQKRENRQ